jgi:hypothetical protein
LRKLYGCAKEEQKSGENKRIVDYPQNDVLPSVLLSCTWNCCTYLKVIELSLNDFRW